MYAHAGAVLEGRIYIACGCRGPAYLRETYCFDPGADAWSACAEGPVERAWHAMAALGGRIYVIGGSNNTFRCRRDVLTVRRHVRFGDCDPPRLVSPSAQVACFHPEADSWSLVAPLPAGHGEPGIAVLDRRIYVLGGRSHDRGHCLRYVHEYDADSNEWGGGVDLKERVSGLAACVALMPPGVLAKAQGWEQCTNSSLDEDADMDNSEESSED